MKKIFLTIACLSIFSAAIIAQDGAKQGTPKSQKKRITAQPAKKADTKTLPAEKSKTKGSQTK